MKNQKIVLLDYNKWAANALHPQRVQAFQQDFNLITQKVRLLVPLNYKKIQKFWVQNKLQVIHSLFLQGEDKVQYYQVLYQIFLLHYCLKTPQLSLIGTSFLFILYFSQDQPKIMIPVNPDFLLQSVTSKHQHSIQIKRMMKTLYQRKAFRIGLKCGLRTMLIRSDGKARKSLYKNIYLAEKDEDGSLRELVMPLQSMQLQPVIREAIEADRSYNQFKNEGYSLEQQIKRIKVQHSQKS